MAQRFAKLVSLITPKRRWFQFRLLTMFIAVTVFCLLLGDYVNPVRRLERQLRDPSKDVRAHAAKSLGNLGSEARSAAKSLLLAMGDNSAWVRSEAAWALSRVSGRGDLLAPFLADPSIHVRLDTAEGMLWAGGDPTEVVPILLDAAVKDYPGFFHSDRVASEFFSALGPDQASVVVPLLLDSLAVDDDSSRKAAADALEHVSLPTSNVAPALIVRLRHERPEVRAAASKQLRRLGSSAKQAAAALRELLYDPDPEVRVVMAAALGAVDPDDSQFLVVLTRSLRAKDEAPRRMAAECLATLGPIAASASNELVVALGDPSRDVTLAAAHALEKIGPAAVLALERALEQTLAEPDPWQDISDAVAATLECIGRATVAVLERALELADPDSSDAAADAHKHIGPAAVSALEWALEQARALSDPEFRPNAADVLGWLGPLARSSVPVLVAVLDHGGRSLRESAIGTLGKIGKDAAPAVPYLLQFIDSNDDLLRIATNRTLEIIAVLDEPSRAQLMADLTGGRPRKRLAAAAILFACGEPPDQILPTLIEFVTCDDDWLVMHAWATLARMGPAAAPAIGPIAGIPDERLERLSQRMGGWGLPSIGLATAPELVVPELIDELQDRDPRSRAGAAAALGKIGAEANASIPALVELLDDDERWHGSFSDNGLLYEVRESVIEALGQIGPQAHAAVPKLVRLLEEMRKRGSFSDQVTVIRALGGIGPGSRSAVPAILRFANSVNQDVSDEVTISLARIDRDHPSLVQCLKNSLAFCVRRSQQCNGGGHHEFMKLAETVWDLGPRAAPLVPELRRMVTTAPLLDFHSRYCAAFALARFASERQVAVRYMERNAGGSVAYDLAPKLVQRIKDTPLDPAAQ
ncbi:MAG TPA: HEAT repeat domain-containing protein [Pirellulales bacterium]|nr:HEAT repeat domain-containing protein [Pirellulales bacterium]